MSGNLNEYFGSYELSPIFNNILSALITVVYVTCVLELGSFIRGRLGRAEESRKLVHICAGCCTIFWPLFDTFHWSWRLNVLVPTVMAIKLFYKGAILRDPSDPDVQTMSRSSLPSELLYGPLQFTLVMIWIGISEFMTTRGAIIMAILGIGDGIAPLVGKYFGRFRYRLPLFFTSTKSFEGSFFGVFLGSLVGSYFFIYTLGLPPIPYQLLIKYAGIATVIEAASPKGFDNIVVPIFMYWFIPV